MEPEELKKFPRQLLDEIRTLSERREEIRAGVEELKQEKGFLEQIQNHSKEINEIKHFKERLEGKIGRAHV